MGSQKLEYIEEIKQLLNTLEKSWSQDEINELETFSEDMLFWETMLLRAELTSNREDYLESRRMFVHSGYVKDRYKFNEKSFKEIDEMVGNLLNQIGESVPKCINCDSIKFEFNNVKNEILLFSCSNCNHTIELNINIKNEEEGKIDFNMLLTEYLNNLSEIFEYFYTIDELEEFFRDKYYKYNPSKKILSGIRLNTNPNLEQSRLEPKSNDAEKRSRRIPQDVMDKVWNRDGGECVECGSNENLEFDHIIPFSKGGANTYRNIQLLCEKCNRSKSDKIG